MKLVCAPNNDLHLLLTEMGRPVKRYDSAEKAIAEANDGEALLILAEKYPAETTSLDAGVFVSAEGKSLKLYVEFPSFVPGHEVAGIQSTHWERAVVSSEAFGELTPKLRILSIHDCHYIAMKAPDPLIVVGRVAGYDKAVFGLPQESAPLLFEISDRNIIISTTKLSQFITARYAPVEDIAQIWRVILEKLEPQSDWSDFSYTPVVQPYYGPGENLPEDVEMRTFSRAMDWIHQSRLLIHPEREPMLHEKLKAGIETTPVQGPDEPVGDGSLGILEGYEAHIQQDGSQPQRLPIRSDNHGELAMQSALHWLVKKSERGRQTAENLLEYMFLTSDMHGGDRANPEHPSYGHIAWGVVQPLWEIANYGDDDARVALSVMGAAAALNTDRWNERILRILVANLRTTGPLGFRAERVDMGPLEEHGWKHFYDTEIIQYSPHFQSYLWACYLWGYEHTGHKEFLEKTENAIRMMMDVYPEWVWKDTIERARMMLCLAWLLRVDDTPEHREWLDRIAKDLLSFQQPSGAIRESMAPGGDGFFAPLKSNEEYGTGEVPLIQENGNPCSDQLYCSGFALLGLHEAFAVTGDRKLKDAEDRLAQYLCRIQIHSEKIPYLDGAWFRAFDYERWEPWGSSGDIGWGAWSIEAGWGQAWISSVLALRELDQSLWDFTAGIDVRKHLGKVMENMGKNQGGPWKKKTE